MRFQHLVCLLLASLTYGQTTAPTTAPPPEPGATERSRRARQSPEVKIGPTMCHHPEGILLDASLKDDAAKPRSQRLNSRNWPNRCNRECRRRFADNWRTGMGGF